MPAVTNMTQKDLLEVVPPFIAQGSSAMVRLLELPPGDPGLGPHRHSGPVFGYMLEGEMLFELEGQAPYPIKAGEAFWEPGGDVSTTRLRTCFQTGRADSSWSCYVLLALK
jgi:quercetin dioxygenase-like cupin family protein